jgi:predicted nuclease of predicted toxin-antitoxin system
VKLLLDQNIPVELFEHLRGLGHDTEHVRDWNKRALDHEVLARANHEMRVLISFDTDYGELAILFRQPHRGIVIPRKVEKHDLLELVPRLLDQFATDLEHGGVVSASLNKWRVHLLE